MTEPTTHANVAVMTNVLVTYASKHGSTAEIAEAVAERLQEHGLRADCVDVAEAASLEPYDAVVLGSAVYMKRWRGDARHFLRKHGKELSRLPFWVFSSGPTGDPAKDDPSWIEPKSVARKAEALGAREHIVFGGRVPAGPEGADAASNGRGHAAGTQGPTRLGSDPRLGLGHRRRLGTR